jgi:hypothetical protein
MPIGQISLPATFGTQETFRTKTIQFQMADFEAAYNAFLGRPALTKFMVIPHYAYLVLKMAGPRGVISIRGDVKRAYDCDKVSCEMADRLAASAELQDLKKALAKSTPPQTQSWKSIQPEDALSKQIPLSTEEPSKVAHIGNTLDPK